MLGYYFRRFNLVEILKAKNWIFTISVIGFICLLNANIEIHVLRFLSERIVRPTLAIFTITYLFAIRENENSKVEQWLNNIGTKTLDIYIYHGTLVFGAYSCFDMKFIKQNEIMMANPLSYLIIAILITLFLTYASIGIGALVRKSEILEKIIYGKLNQ